MKRIELEDSNNLLIGNRCLIDENGIQRSLTISDLSLYVKIPKNTELEQDNTCDSVFMLNSVHKVGRSIQGSIHWVQVDEPIILFMANAGGHGTNIAKEQYASILMEDYKIMVQWQIPNLPKTNLLDLDSGRHSRQ